jgi:AmiR/NasT family two-component response regulator
VDAVVEQAKGFLAVSHSVGIEDAAALLAARAALSNQPVGVVARQVLEREIEL